MQYLLAAQLNPTGTGAYTYTPSFPNTYKRQDGSSSQAGDVLSVQPDGSLQTRSAGTAGAYEICTREGVALFYQPTPGVFFMLLPVA